MPFWKASLRLMDDDGERSCWQTANAAKAAATQSDQISLRMFFDPQGSCLLVNASATRFLDDAMASNSVTDRWLKR